MASLDAAGSSFPRPGGVVVPLLVIEYLTSDEMVKIYVGPERKLCVLHENLICDKVQFFSCAFKGGFKEGTTKTMELPEDDIDAFALLVRWMYKDDALWDTECSEREKDPDNYCCHPKADSLHGLRWCKLWVLADKFGLEELQQNTHDVFKDCRRTCYGPQEFKADAIFSDEIVRYVFENTADESPLQVFMIAHAVHQFYAPCYGSTNAQDKKAPGDCFHGYKKFREAVMTGVFRHLHINKEDCQYGPCSLHSSYSETGLYGKWREQIRAEPQGQPQGTW